MNVHTKARRGRLCSRPRVLLFATIFVWLAAGPRLRAEDIRFPPSVYPATKTNGSVFNVRDYGAAGNGVADDTAAIQRAINASQGFNHHGIVYFPNGTYKVGALLRHDRTSDPYAAGLILQGQSRDGVIIVLAEAAAGYADSANPKAVLDTATGTSADGGTFNHSAFMIHVQNLTIDVGKNNPGAVALRFHANNVGAVRDVHLRSSDPNKRGKYGLQIGNIGGPGPFLIQNVSVDGFEEGIRVTRSEYSVTFEHIRVTDQSVAGLRNYANVLTVRAMTSSQNNAAVPALLSSGNSAVVTILSSTLDNRAGSAQSAVDVSSGFLFARAVTTSGYASAIKAGTTVVPGLDVYEYASTGVARLFPSADPGLRLPVEETPPAPWGDPATWADIRDFGATSGGSNDDAIGIQRAIDSGAQIIYFPWGSYHLKSTVRVRNNVRRILGGWSKVWVLPPLRSSDAPAFQFDTPNPGVDEVFLDSLHLQYQDGSNAFHFVRHASQANVVLRDLFLGEGKAYRNTGSGSLFVENVFNIDDGHNSSNRSPVWKFSGEQRVWARQINPEHRDCVRLQNDGATLWVLGVKTEKLGPVIDTRGGGATEVLGGFIFGTRATTGVAPTPAFVNHESSVSITACEHQSDAARPTYNTVVEETRGGVTRVLDDDLLPNRMYSSFVLTSYVGVPQGSHYYFEAEDYAIAPWYPVDDSAASAGRYVVTNVSTSTVPANGHLQFPFSGAGAQAIWIRVYARTSNDDSLYLRMDNGAWYTWNNIPAAAGWTWCRWDNTASLPPGDHVLTIAHRENGVKLDKVLVTPDLAFRP